MRCWAKEAENLLRLVSLNRCKWNPLESMIAVKFWRNMLNFVDVEKAMTILVDSIKTEVKDCMYPQI